MGRSLAKVLSTQPPKGLLSIMDDPPLTAYEMVQDYYDLFEAIVIAAKPSDAIDWLHVKCVVDLTWEMQREKAIKTGIVTLMQQEVVQELLKSTEEAPSSLESHVHRVFGAKDAAKQWSVDLVVTKEIDAKLAAKGHPPSDIQARAYMRGANQIAAVDRRTASYELRRMVALREIERRNARFARQLEEASSEIIDAEFNEAPRFQS
jgi:hypothetical protein